jgi:hypothetical protein
MTEILDAIAAVLPNSFVMMIPGPDEEELVIYADRYKAMVRCREDLPVFVIVDRTNNHLVTWGEGQTIMEACEFAVGILHEICSPAEERRLAA